MNQPCDKVREIIGDVIAAESAGQVIADQRVISRHPGLADQLPDALQSLQAIRCAQVQSQAAGSIDEPLKLYSDDELAAPIVADEDGDGSESAPDLIQDWIAGYELLEQIGQGGQATVYRARRMSTGGPVAIKILPGGFFATTRARARFEREAQALVRVSHPNVVPVYDKGRTRDGSLFIVMQYVEGLQLNIVLAGETDSIRIAGIFRKIALAVHELHRCGIIHRDLKPSNVMIDRYGEPHVLDFGLARVNEMPGVTDTGQVLGSIPWASPEQAAGRLGDVDERSDIYCIGVMLASILDGKLPYPASDSPMETARHICHTPAIVGRGRKSGPLDGIALKCLAKEPARRYATAAELAAEFARVASGGRPLVQTCQRRSSRWLLLVPFTVILLGTCLAITTSKVMSAFNKVDSAKNPPHSESIIELPSMTNSLGMRFVLVPAGSFTMGSPPQEHGHDYWEEQRLVQISHPFSLAVTETTQDVYQKVMKANPSDARFRGPNLPVQMVSFVDAMEFCERLGMMDGHHYRLPSEEEWEYACRASSDAKALPASKLHAMAWYAQDSGGVLHAVASLESNRWGLYDMLGGVSEWCSGTVEPTEKKSGATTKFGIVKGGAFDLPAAACRSAGRSSMPHHFSAPDLGFRVICEP